VADAQAHCRGRGPQSHGAGGGGSGLPLFSVGVEALATADDPRARGLGVLDKLLDPRELPPTPTPDGASQSKSRQHASTQACSIVSTGQKTAWPVRGGNSRAGVRYLHLVVDGAVHDVIG
jgi:hypothetical protein